MERIFSPWRMEYIRGGGSGPSRCIFCVPEEEAGDPERLLLGIYPLTLAIVNRYPYNNGHVMLAPRRHVADLDRLTEGERAELFSLLALSASALREEYRAEGFNVGMNLGKVAGAGVADHLHVHLVPRWGGDTNFMASVCETRVLPESLAQTRERLAARFSGLRP